MPIKYQQGVPSGTPPSQQDDPVGAMIEKFAYKMIDTGIKAGRAEDYLRGVTAAAVEGTVKAGYDQASPVAKVFGGGASMSGASKYMEVKKLAEWKQHTIDNMSEYASMSPEEFADTQIEGIKQFYTDDDETNAHIMSSFSTALPEVAAIHQSANYEYIQHQHVTSMTDAVKTSLKFSTSVHEKAPENAWVADDNLSTVLERPPGMNKDTYKEFLYDMLPLAAAQSNGGVAQKIIEQGLVENPDDQVKLEKASAESIKVQAGKELYKFGEAEARLRDFAKDPTHLFKDVLEQIYKTKESFGATANTHFTSAKVASILGENLTARKKFLAQDNLQDGVKELMRGNPGNIESSKMQDVINLANAELENIPKDSPDYPIQLEANLKWHKQIKVPDKQMQAQWAAGIVDPVSLDEDGLPIATETAVDVIKKMDYFYNNDDGTGVFNRTASSDTAAFYRTYRDVRAAMPEASQGVLLQTTVDRMTKAKEQAKEGTVRIERQTMEDMKDSFYDVTGWDKDNLLNSYVGSEMSSILAKNLKVYGTVDSAVAASAAEMNQRYEPFGDTFLPKFDGKSIADRVGYHDPFYALDGMVKIQRERFGKYGDNPVYTLDGSRDQFRVSNKDQLGIATIVSFKEVAAWGNQKDDSPLPDNITANQTANRKIILGAARKAIIQEGRLQQFHDEFSTGKPHMDDAALKERVNNMDEDELVSQYTTLLDERGMNPLQKIGEWFAKSSLGTGNENYNKDSGVTPIGVSIGNLLGYAGQNDIKQVENSVNEALQFENELEQARAFDHHMASTSEKVIGMKGVTSPIPETIVQDVYDKEGFSDVQYKDSLGNTTFANGLNLDTPEPEVVAWMDAGGKLEDLTVEEAQSLQHDILQRKWDTVNTTFPAIHDNAKKAVLHMYYQLGDACFTPRKDPEQNKKVFRGVRNALNSVPPDYKSAAENCIWNDPADHSKGHTGWYTQTPERCTYVAGLFKAE